MNGFFILLLYFLVQVKCLTVFQNGPGILNPEKKQRIEEGEKSDSLASVRQYPSLLHKCTATFIAPHALLTTAKCLYCENCHLFVHALSSRLTDETKYSKGVSYTIKKTVIHPEYERVPQKNNIGLIQLDTKVGKAVVFRLPTSVPEFFGSAVDTYRWLFTPDFREYNLERITEQTISNAACSSFFNQYIDYKHICTRRNQSIVLGEFDQGVPIVDKTMGVNTIVGIYEAEGKIHQSKVEVYQAIFPYVGWINQILTCNFNCNSSADNKTSPTPSSIPTSAPTGLTSSPSTEIPDNDNTTIVIPTILPNEADEAQEPKSEKKEPNAASGDFNSQRNNKPFRWSANFPFSEQKQALFKPNTLSGKRVS